MQDCSYKHISERVKEGKIAEAAIISRLKEMGWLVSESSSKEDRISKIDCYLNSNPAQIKVRATGDDIVVEVIRPFVGPKNPDNQQGRDMKGSYTHYVLGGRKGEDPRIYLRTDVVNLINGALHSWECESFPLTGSGPSKWYKAKNAVQICVKKDNRDGVQKLLCYIDPSFLKEQLP